MNIYARQRILCRVNINEVMLKRCAGALAVLAIVILKIPDLGTVDIANALEWVFYVVLPNFCFNKALQDLITKHQFSSVCSKIDEVIDREMFCDIIRNNSKTNPCCPGKLLSYRI